MGEGCRLEDIFIYIYIYYYTPLPLNLANNKQQATTSNNKQHVSLPFWPLLRANASDHLPMWSSWSLGGALAKSKF